MTVVAGLLALALVGAVGCDLSGPDSVPKDPGTIIGVVLDPSGAPLANVWVYVHDIPNSVGTTYTVGVPTNAYGTATITEIPAGRRRVDVKPPDGYAAPAAVTVVVVKDQSSTIGFVLTKNSA